MGKGGVRERERGDRELKTKRKGGRVTKRGRTVDSEEGEGGGSETRVVQAGRDQKAFK